MTFLQPENFVALVIGGDIIVAMIVVIFVLWAWSRGR
jgi:uncharacterized membrane protein YqiK